MPTQEQEPLINACPECGEAIDVSDQPPYAKIECPHCKSSIRVRTLLGQYQIERLLGEGGMSQVFLARDETLGRSVALKVLHKELSRDKKLTDSFEREAKITASINHPNVVKVYTVGADYGYFFIAMELMDNVSLEEMITNQGRVPEKQVMQIACDVTNGLEAAFKAGLIHRDIKPGNILLTNEGMAKLVDFGLAVQAGHYDADEDVWATPFYVPPEKLEGEPDDFRGDIYSLGATLFHAVSGTPPYAANTASLDELKKIKAKTIRLIDSVPNARKRTCGLIDRMMARNPADRHQNYKDLLTDLNDAAAKLGSRRYSGSSMAGAMGEDSGKPVWKRPAVVVGIIALLAIVIGSIFLGSQDDDLSKTLLAGGEDRVLVAGEQNTAARYVAAREVLEEGRFSEAGEVFQSLLSAEDLKEPILSWTKFNLGLCLLLEGKERQARGAFLKLAEGGEKAGADKGTAEVVAFFRLTSRALIDVLPVRNEGPAAAEGGLPYKGIEYLVFGLKNWNQGQFESAVRFFRQFQAAAFPEPYSWIEALKKQTVVYQQDGAILKDLPNPHLSMSDEDLNKALKQLAEAKEKLVSDGPAPRFVEARIARIQGLIDEKKRLALLPPKKPLVKDVAANDAAASGGPPPAGKTASMSANPLVPNGAAPAPMPVEFEPSGEVLEELKKLWAIEEVALGLGANFEFPQALSRFEMVEVKTPLGLKLVADEMQILKKAEVFLGLLVAKLNEGRYEGTVIRKEGKPLDAKITGATREMLTVDLGFGGNQVALVEFAPSWLLAAARDTLGGAEANPEIIGNAVCFAWATGEHETARQLIAKGSGSSGEFKEMWERVMKNRPR